MLFSRNKEKEISNLSGAGARGMGGSHRWATSCVLRASGHRTELGSVGEHGEAVCQEGRRSPCTLLTGGGRHRKAG